MLIWQKIRGWKVRGVIPAILWSLSLLMTAAAPSEGHIIGSWKCENCVTDPQDVVVVENIAYVADGDGGLRVADVSDPKNPAIIASVDTLGYANGVAIAGNMAYLACGSYEKWNGLQVISVSDPESPVIIGSVDIPGSAYGVAVTGDTAYVASGWGGLQVIDVSDPKHPVIIGYASRVGYASDIDVMGDTVYVAAESSGLNLIDVSNLEKPVIISSVGNDAQGLTIAGGMAYLADDNEGFQVIDVSDPANPAIIGIVDYSCDANDLAVAGDTAYLACNFLSSIGGRWNGLKVIDVRGIRNPLLSLAMWERQVMFRV